MEDVLNPVEQLAAILKRLATPQGTNLGIAVCRATGRSSDSVPTDIEQSRDYAAFLYLATSALEFVEQNAPQRAQERYMNYLQNVLRVIASNSIKSTAGTFQGHYFSPEHVERLEAMAEALSDHGSQRRASADELAELLKQLDQVLEFVRSCQMDNRLRARIIKTLGIVRLEVSRVNIIGTEEAITSFDTLLGESVRAALSAKTEGEKEDALALLKNVTQAGEYFGKIVDVGQKIFPPLLAGAKALGWVQ